MNKPMVVGIALVALVLVGLLVLRSMGVTPNTQTPQVNIVQDQLTPSPETDTKGDAGTTSPPEVKVTAYTLQDVAAHSKAEDCWIAIEGNVYDMTPYIQKQIHPGGAAILFGCGKDATAVFNLRPKDNKPHSQNARNMLEKYYLGPLAQ